MKAAWNFNINNRDNLYWKRLEDNLEDLCLDINIDEITVFDIDTKFRSNTRKDLMKIKTMQCLRIPRIWW